VREVQHHYRHRIGLVRIRHETVRSFEPRTFLLFVCGNPRHLFRIVIYRLYFVQTS
jgi:hypothetical protein